MAWLIQFSFYELKMKWKSITESDIINLMLKLNASIHMEMSYVFNWIWTFSSNKIFTSEDVLQHCEKPLTDNLHIICHIINILLLTFTWKCGEIYFYCEMMLIHNAQTYRHHIVHCVSVGFYINGIVHSFW